jgi:translation elongation factor EF-G
MLGLASNPEMVRNIAIVGHLHHGKTSLVDMLVYETHKLDFDCGKPVCITRLPVATYEMTREGFTNACVHNI